MKKCFLSRRILCAVLACIFLLSTACLTAFAADAPGGEGSPGAADEPAVTDEPDAGDNTAGEEPTDAPDSGASATENTPDDPDSGYVTPDETEPGEGEAQTEAPEDIPAYVEPEHLDELPTVNKEDVVVATAIPVPQAVVTDASLASGIIMWICVAVGIAVVVGVMVSKRTRRRGG